MPKTMSFSASALAGSQTGFQAASATTTFVTACSVAPWSVAPWTSAVEDPLWQEMENWGKAISWKKGESLPGGLMYLIRGGLVRIMALSLDGQQRSIGLLAPGSLLGDTSIFRGLHLAEEALTLTSGSAVAFSEEVVMGRFLKHPELALYILRNMASKSYLMSSQLIHASFLSSEQRMAQFFYHLHQEQQVEGSQVYESLAALPLTALAEITGMHRVTVTSIVNAFKRMNLLERRQERLVVLNPEGLLALLSL